MKLIKQGYTKIAFESIEYADTFIGRFQGYCETNWGLRKYWINGRAVARIYSQHKNHYHI